MKFCSICAVLVSVLSFQMVNLLEVQSKETFQRHKRGILDFFGDKTTTTLKPTTQKPILPNNLDIGVCEDDDKVNKTVKFKCKA